VWVQNVGELWGSGGVKAKKRKKQCDDENVRKAEGGASKQNNGGKPGDRAKPKRSGQGGKRGTEVKRAKAEN